MKMDSSEETGGRVTRSRLKRLGSVESDVSSRPDTPINKLVAISETETDSASRSLRKTRRNSVTAASGAGAGTPIKSQLSHLTKTNDVNSPRKITRRSIIGEKENTPNRRVTRSQSISPPSLELPTMKTRARKISTAIKEVVKEADEEDETVNSSSEEPKTRPEETKSEKKRNMSESSKSVNFSESVLLDEAEKTVYPKTPLHVKSISGADLDVNMSIDASSSFNELFGGDDVNKSQNQNHSIEDEGKAFIEGQMLRQSKLSKISSTPKNVVQHLQIKLKKLDNKVSKPKSVENTPVEKVKDRDDNAELYSEENNKESLNESMELNNGSLTKSCILIYSPEDVGETLCSPTPNQTNTSKEDSLTIDSSSKKTRNSLLDSIVNEEGNVRCSQKRISLSFEADQDISMQKEKPKSRKNSLNNEKDTSIQEEKSQNRRNSLKDMSLVDSNMSMDEQTASIQEEKSQSQKNSLKGEKDISIQENKSESRRNSLKNMSLVDSNMSLDEQDTSIQEEKSQSRKNSFKNMSLDECNSSNIHNKSSKSINLSKLATKSPAKTSDSNKSMQDDNSNNDEAENTDQTLSLRTIPVAFENDSATLPKECKTLECTTKSTKIAEDCEESTSKKLSQSFSVNKKDTKTSGKIRYSEPPIHISQEKEDLDRDGDGDDQDSKEKESVVVAPENEANKLEKSKTEETNLETEESTKRQPDIVVDDSTNDSEKEFISQDAQKTNKILRVWGSMNVHGSSNHKIDSIKFDESKENDKAAQDLESDFTVFRSRRKNRQQFIGNSDDEDSENPEKYEDEEEEEIDDDEKPYKSHPFVESFAIEVSETYESGDSLDSELEEEMRENEISTYGESLGSEDTEVSDADEDDENDSFVTNDSEIELLDYDDDDEGINSVRNKDKRRFVFTSSEEDEDDLKSGQEEKRPKGVESEVEEEVQEEDDERKKSKKSRKSLNQSKLESEEDTEKINEDKKTPKKSRKSLNQSKFDYEEETKEIAVEVEEENEEKNTSKKSRKSLNQSKLESEEDTEKINEDKKTPKKSRKSLNQSKSESVEEITVEVEKGHEEKKTPKKSRKSLNQSKFDYEEEVEEGSFENKEYNELKKSPRKREKSLNEQENEVDRKENSNKEEVGAKENLNNSLQKKNIQNSPAKKRLSIILVEEVEEENQVESEKDKINMEESPINEMEEEIENNVESTSEERKRKRMSQSFYQSLNMSSVDNETVHQHKKTKFSEMETENEPILQQNQTNNKLNDSAMKRQRIQERCDEILEAANRAKLEAKLKAKQKPNKLHEKKLKPTKHIDENIPADNEVDTQSEHENQESEKCDDLKEAMNRALKASATLLLCKGNAKKEAVPTIIEEKIKSRQLPEEVMGAIMKKDSPVKQKKADKKVKKNSPEKTEKFKNKLFTSAGEVRVIPSTPPPKNKHEIETIQTATGIVRVEPVTPSLSQRAGLLRESPVTPHSIGFRVRQLLGEHKLPECPNKKHSKKRKLMLDEDEPANKKLQPKWTTSGVFKVEKSAISQAKKVLGTSNNTNKYMFQRETVEYFGASENALQFKMNALAKVGVPTESSSKILQRKKRQQLQQRF